MTMHIYSLLCPAFRWPDIFLLVNVVLFLFFVSCFKNLIVIVLVDVSSYVPCVQSEYLYCNSYCYLEKCNLLNIRILSLVIPVELHFTPLK